MNWYRCVFLGISFCGQNGQLGALLKFLLMGSFPWPASFRGVPGWHYHDTAAHFWVVPLCPSELYINPSFLSLEFYYLQNLIFFLLSQLVIENSPQAIGEVWEQEGIKAGIRDLDIRVTSSGKVLMPSPPARTILSKPLPQIAAVHA